MRALINLHNGLVEVAGATEVARADVQEMLRSTGSVGEATRALVDQIRTAEVGTMLLNQGAQAFAQNAHQITDVVEAGILGMDQLRNAGTGIIADLHLMDGVAGDVRQKVSQIDPRAASQEIQALLADLRTVESTADQIDGVLTHLKGKNNAISKDLAANLEGLKKGELSVDNFLAKVRQMKAAVDRTNPNSALGAMLQFLEQAVAQENVRGAGVNGPGLGSILGGGGGL